MFKTPLHLFFEKFQKLSNKIKFYTTENVSKGVLEQKCYKYVYDIFLKRFIHSIVNFPHIIMAIGLEQILIKFSANSTKYKI